MAVGCALPGYGKVTYELCLELVVWNGHISAVCDFQTNVETLE